MKRDIQEFCQFSSVRGLPDRIRIGVINLPEALIFDVSTGGVTDLGEKRKAGDRATVIWWSSHAATDEILRRFEIVSPHNTLFRCKGTPAEYELAYHYLWHCAIVTEEDRTWRQSGRRGGQRPFSQPKPLWPLLSGSRVIHPENDAEEPLHFEISIPGAMARYRDRIPFEMPAGLSEQVIVLAAAMLEAHGALKPRVTKCVMIREDTSTAHRSRRAWRECFPGSQHSGARRQNASWGILERSEDPKLSKKRKSGA